MTGVKLGINTLLAAVGVVLAPIAFGLSLALTAAGILMVGWDWVEFGRESLRLRRDRAALKGTKRRIQKVQAELREIDELLTKRLGPP